MDYNLLEDPNRIHQYLYYGFLIPRQLELPIQLDRDNHRNSSTSALDELIVEGVDRLDLAFRNQLGKCSSGSTHVIPLSGGLDSRAILGGLLKNLDSREIQIVTFGSPGTWDYEIGQQVARAVRVRCELIDLTKGSWRWNTNDLVETAIQTKCPVWIFDAHVNRQVAYRYGTAPTYWSGFMGDPLAGSHLLPTDSADWRQAQSFFVQRNRFVRLLELAPTGFDPKRHLPEKPFSDNTPLCYDEQLDFGIRQQCLIRHIVLPIGYDYQTPFLQKEWINFILSVPRPYRAGQYLYKEILKAAYPALFSLPTKTNFGLPLNVRGWRKSLQVGKLHVGSIARRLFPWRNWGVFPGINYIDFNHGLRKRSDLQQVIYENIHDLKKRKIIDWVDIDRIWCTHQNHQGNFADALTLFASLEIFLKAQEV
jgi:hypothetical protein